MDRNPLFGLFNPRSVAVFGASPRPGSVGARVLANMQRAGFEGDLIAINPKHRVVGDIACHPTLAAAGKPIDLAVIATPAATVPGIIQQCGDSGTRNAIVLSAGFGEGGGAGAELASALALAARRAAVRVLGPNCVGMVRPWLGMDTTFLRAETPRGRLALVSQSGALVSAIAD